MTSTIGAIHSKSTKAGIHDQAEHPVPGIQQQSTVAPHDVGEPPLPPFPLAPQLPEAVVGVSVHATGSGTNSIRAGCPVS